MCSSSSASQQPAICCVSKQALAALARTASETFFYCYFIYFVPASAYDSFSSTIRMLLIFLFCCYVLALELLRIYFSSPLQRYFLLFWWSEIFSPLISNPLFYARLLLLLLRIVALLLWVWQSLGWSRRCCFAWLRAREKESETERKKEKKRKTPKKKKSREKSSRFSFFLLSLCLLIIACRKKKEGNEENKNIQQTQQQHLMVFSCVLWNKILYKTSLSSGVWRMVVVARCRRKWWLESSGRVEHEKLQIHNISVMAR